MNESPSAVAASSTSFDSETCPLTIGVDFGGTSVKIGVVRGAEIIGEIARIPTQRYDGPDDLLDAIVEEVATMRERHPEIGAIGIGVPGAVDFERGMTYNLTNVPGWSNVPLRDMISEKTGLPTVLENDANCAAYAEFKCGAGRGLRNVVVVTLGTGVGGGLILNGELFRGSQYAAGEIGQMSIDYNGVDGPYGNWGALERYVGNQQITQIGVTRFTEAGREVKDDICSPQSLAEAAYSGDEIAHQVWHVVADYLGTALTSIVYLLNPDAIIIGGGVAHAGDILFDPLKARIKAMLSDEFFEALQIIPATFGNTAGIIGSAALADDLVE
ncbi:MAG: ROK family protein [Verrucomicrobiae bacterium]|nr:ROK family protein [Verrucomicrobiae bacterium]